MKAGEILISGSFNGHLEFFHHPVLFIHAVGSIRKAPLWQQALINTESGS